MYYLKETSYILSLKIAEWGAEFNPFKFVTDGLSQITTTIPETVAPGDYLVRIEQIALHVSFCLFLSQLWAYI